MQRTGSRVDSHSSANPAVGSEFALKCLHFGAERVVAAFEHAQSGGRKFVTDALILSLQVDDWNHRATASAETSTGLPRCRSDASAASRIWTTRSPDSPPVRGGWPELTQPRKCPTTFRKASAVSK